MTEPKFTKGPWNIEYKPGLKTRGNSHVVLNPERFPAAFVPAWDAPEDGEEFAADEASANAALIAAAPDMFEALRAAREALASAKPIMAHYEESCARHEAAIKAVDAALAKSLNTSSEKDAGHE
jgi:hypothetical protein